MKKYMENLSFGKDTNIMKKEPYVIYKLDGQNKISFLIAKYADLKKSDEMFNGIFKSIRENGMQLTATKLDTIGKGKILYKSSNGMYAIYKENKTKAIYVLMYVDYGDIEKWFRKIRIKKKQKATA